MPSNFYCHIEVQFYTCFYLLRSNLSNLYIKVSHQWCSPFGTSSNCLFTVLDILSVKRVSHLHESLPQTVPKWLPPE
jgi:hypothetical protein